MDSFNVAHDLSLRQLEKQSLSYHSDQFMFIYKKNGL